MNIVDELHAIAAALRGARIPYAVCGGIAVTAYGETLLRMKRLAGRAIDLADIEKLEGGGDGS